MSDIQPIQPTGSTPEPSQTSDSSATTSSTDSTTQSSKKEQASTAMYTNLELVFMNSPYVQASSAAEAVISNPENEDKVMKASQTYAKQAHQNKQDLESSQKQAEAAIEAYDTEVPNTTQTSKNKGS